MLLIHANYLDENFELVQGDIEIQDGKILRVGKDLPRKDEDLAVDCSGNYTVVPGFVVPARIPVTVPEKRWRPWRNSCCSTASHLSARPL